jgi:hypothetical protein
MPTTQFDPKHPERGWQEAKPLQPPPHWHWLQRIVNWFWKIKK